MLRLAFLAVASALLVSTAAQQVSPQVCQWYRTYGIALPGCNNFVPVPAPAPSTSTCAAMLCLAGTTCIEGRGCVSTGSTGTTCSMGEQFMQCSTCETTCGQSNMACAMMCGPPKCQCQAGYARDLSSGRCVLQTQCPANDGGCNAMRCPIGQQCVEELVMCVRAPCPPIARCVSVTTNGNGVGSCATRMCPAGQRCVEQMLMCISPPCGTTSACV